MKIVLLGATGETGQVLVEQALSKGLTITAVVRDVVRAQKKLPESPSLSFVSCDIFDAKSLVPAFMGQDAVVSTLGFNKQVDSKMTLFTESMSAIISAMREAKIRRLVTISAWFTDPGNRDEQPMFQGWSKLPGLVNTLDNEGEMETMLLEAKADIEFTSVRAPGLTWDPVSTKQIVIQDANWVDSTRGSGFIAREDVARFMLSTLDDPAKWNHRMPAVAVQYTKEEMTGVMSRFRAHYAEFGDHRAPEEVKSL